MDSITVEGRSDDFVYNSKVTKMFKSCFGGDIITRVYVENGRKVEKSTHNSIDWSGANVVVMFSNGQKVLMTNSEWAFFRQI